jgi:hypothetical protein
MVVICLALVTRVLNINCDGVSVVVFPFAGIAEHSYTPKSNSKSDYQKPNLRNVEVDLTGVLYTCSLAIQVRLEYRLLVKILISSFKNRLCVARHSTSLDSEGRSWLCLRFPAFTTWLSSVRLSFVRKQGNISILLTSET